MTIDEFAAYCIIVIFWVFIAFPVIFSFPNETYRDICIVSVKVHLMGAAALSIFSSLVWAITRII